MNGLKHFGRTMEQTTETVLPSPKTISAPAITTYRITSLRTSFFDRVHGETFQANQLSFQIPIENDILFCDY